MLAQQVNEQLVDNLHDIWQREKGTKRNEFVNIAKLGRTDDRILQEQLV